VNRDMAETHFKAASGGAPRPLSPHLTIFRPLMTTAMSIMHRITGVALYFGMLFLAWWLVAAASGPEAFSTASAFFGSFFGRLILLGFTWALIHHMLGGIRHLIWDTGAGLDLPTVDRLAWATLVGSVSLTLIVWIFGYIVR
jgi:succinate dehydrogenase / fumarate reductase cytochrome b subunit